MHKILSTLKYVLKVNISVNKKNPVIFSPIYISVILQMTFPGLKAIFWEDAQ